MNITEVIKKPQSNFLYFIGLAVIGYLGFRIIRWILDKCKKTEKVERLAKEKINKVPLTTSTGRLTAAGSVGKKIDEAASRKETQITSQKCKMPNSAFQKSLPEPVKNSSLDSNSEVVRECKKSFDENNANIQKTRDLIKETIKNLQNKKLEYQATISQKPDQTERLNDLFKKVTANELNNLIFKISILNNSIKLHNGTVKTLETMSNSDMSRLLVPEVQNTLTKELGLALTAASANA